MPIHNEDTGPVFARLGAMVRSLREARTDQAFDLFVLSDTRNVDIARRESVENHDRAEAVLRHAGCRLECLELLATAYEPCA